MKNSYCPICYGKLDVRDTTPCMDCGVCPEELEHLTQGKHTYAEFEIVFGLILTLCDFCQVDFGSYGPQTWGFPDNRRIGYEDMIFKRDVEPVISKTKFCPNCGYGLDFLIFLPEVREKAPQISSTDKKKPY